MKKGYKIEKGLCIIPQDTTVIAAEAFADCTDLISIAIPDSETEIGDFAFSGCTNLTDIILPNSLKKIGWCAFAGCTCLTEIKIPNSLETIEYGANRLVIIWSYFRRFIGHSDNIQIVSKRLKANNINQ